MTKKYQLNESDTSALVVPEHVSVAMDEIAADLGDGLLALAVDAGTGGDAAVDGGRHCCGVRATCRHDPARTATQHGIEHGSVTLGGRQVPATGPRVRATDGSGQVAMPDYELFSSSELLGRRAMERMLAGVSTRRHLVALQPVGAQVEQDATATGNSAVSRKLVAMTESALADLLGADLSGLDLSR